MGIQQSKDGLPCLDFPHGVYAPPIPARTWTRYSPNCGAIAGFTTEQLDMRRKVAILEYRGVPARKHTSVDGRITKVQRYVNAVNGQYLPNRTFAVQSETLTAPNPADLPRGCGATVPVDDCFVLEYSVTGNALDTHCPPPPEPTSASDVPGPVIMLQLDPAVPVTRLSQPAGVPGESTNNLPDGGDCPPNCPDAGS